MNHELDPILFGMDGEDTGSFSLDEENLGFQVAFAEDLPEWARGRVHVRRYPRGNGPAEVGVLENIRRLVEHDNVVGLVNWGSMAAGTVAQYAASRQVPLLFPHTALIDSTNQRYVFTSFPSYEAEAQMMMRYLVDSCGMRRIAVVHDVNAYGQVFLKQIRQHSAALGYTVTGASSLESRTPPNLQPLLSDLLAQQPDMIFMALYPAQARTLMQAKSALGWGGRMVCAGPLTDEQYLNMPDGSAEGTLGFCYYPDPETSTAPGIAAYRASLQRHRPGHAFNRYSLYGYAFGRLIMEGLRQAGPSVTRESLIDGLESLRHWDSGGILPAVSFSPGRHHAQDAGFIGELRARRIEPLTDWIQLPCTTT
ncbi:MAG: ABC transporter substrate-binding protein [Pigmentiphaga sp.]